MTKIKPMLTAVAVLALMLLAGAGSAAFAQSTPPAGIKGPPRGDLGPQSTPPAGIKGPPRGQLAPSPQPCTPTAGIKGPPRGQLTPPSTLAQVGPQQQPPKQGLVGGIGVRDCKYPFIVALLDHSRPGSAQDQQFCGGTLIDSDSVLTAAHCLFYPDTYSNGKPYPKAGQPKPVTDLRVVVGRTQLTSNEGPERKVSNTYISDSYNSVTMENDVAVLKLTSPVTGITPVKLPPSTDNGYEQPGTLLTIAGWGSAMFGGANSDRMQEAQVPVVSDADAEKSWPDEYFPDIMIAAGERGTSICYGDSGGPLFRIPRTLGGAKPIAPYQYGITSFLSFTGECGGADPAGFTEVNAPSIRGFITASMNK